MKVELEFNNETGRYEVSSGGSLNVDEAEFFVEAGLAIIIDDVDELDFNE